MNTQLNTSTERTPLHVSSSCIERKRFKRGLCLFFCVIFLSGVLLNSCGSSMSNITSNNDDQNAAAKVLLGFCNALKQGDIKTAHSLFSALGNHYTPEIFTLITYGVLAHEAHTTTISSCRVDSVAISSKQGSETALGTITYTMANGRVLKLAQPMEKKNGVWKVASMGNVVSG